MSHRERRTVIDGMIEIAPKWGGKFRQWKEKGRDVFGIVDIRKDMNGIEKTVFLLRVFEG